MTVAGTMTSGMLFLILGGEWGGRGAGPHNFLPSPSSFCWLTRIMKRGPSFKRHAILGLPLLTLLVNVKATRVLRANGYDVGFFGATESRL